MTTTRPYKEKRVYLFTCQKCGRKRARSFKRSRAKKQVCAPCRRGILINRNQLTLV